MRRLARENAMLTNRAPWARHFIAAGLLIGGVVLAPKAAYAVGEQSGRVKGTVIEAQTQAPVPGAQVKITGKNLIGNARIVTTGDDGTFQVYELPPGPYIVEVS